MDEEHTLTISAHNTDVVHLDCTCGWHMMRPGSSPEVFHPWPVKEIVAVSQLASDGGHVVNSKGTLNYLEQSSG
jgi:hypothetical protein